MGVTRQWIHCLLYGESGTRKTTMAATFPTPALVLQFDPPDKAGPYFKRAAKVTPVDDAWYTSRRIECVRLWDEKDNLLYQVEFYNDPEPEYPTAYRYYMERVVRPRQQATGGIYHEAGNPWQTIILDSVTFLTEATLADSRINRNPQYRDGRLHYADAGIDTTRELMARYVNMPCNTVIIAHTAEEKKAFETSEGVIRGAAAIGKLAKSLPTGYGEVYRAFLPEKDATKDPLIQTRYFGGWSAASQIGAPDPCEMDYAKLWGTPPQP